MNPTPVLDRVFPLSASSDVRAPMRPPRLSMLVTAAPGHMMGNRAFLRAWAARRAQNVQSVDPAGSVGGAAAAGPVGHSLS